MKTLRIVCPTCGAHLDVDVDSGQARCRFCNEIFSLDTRSREPEMSDAEQMGYDFERGRQRANVEFTQGFADRVAEARQHMPAMDPESAYVPEPVFYEPAPAPAPAVRDGVPVWLIVLLWIFFPPAGLFATVFTLVRRSVGNPAAAGRAFSAIAVVFMAVWALSCMAIFY